MRAPTYQGLGLEWGAVRRGQIGRIMVLGRKMTSRILPWLAWMPFKYVEYLAFRVPNQSRVLRITFSGRGRLAIQV
jgi:hypothetical protein